ncbi:MAG: hypothetical protein WCE51_08570 [Chthoniobacterales bacterium]|jgi:hypothetical protein
MSVPLKSRGALPLEDGEKPWWQCEEMSAANLIRALAAILFWSLLIGAVAFCYELWRLEHNWRLGMG